MNPITAALIGLVVGVVVQAWRVSRALKCSFVVALKSGGGPGWPPPKK